MLIVMTIGSYALLQHSHAGQAESRLLGSAKRGEETPTSYGSWAVAG